MAGIGRNGWPECSGMSGRDRAEYAIFRELSITTVLKKQEKGAKGKLFILIK